MQQKSQTSLSFALVQWYLQAARDLPWRNTQDPFKIWLSEIILQQTRVEQGLPYYESFTNRFETVTDLAQAEDDEVMRLWQGLGYYSRARNLLKTARIIAFERNGEFPNNAKDLTALPGIGDYTSAAIASFAFGESKGAVDGNVLRVLSRIYNLDLSIDEGKNKKVFQSLADELIQQVDAATFNQATMELGATVCKPKPDCENCPLITFCSAHESGTISLRPVRTKKVKVKEQQLEYCLLIDPSGKVAIRQRPAKGIWSGLYEIIPSEDVDLEGSASSEWETEHKLSHRLLKMRFFRVDSFNGEIKGSYSWIDPKDLEKYAFPVPILSALENWKLL